MSEFTDFNCWLDQQSCSSARRSAANVTLKEDYPPKESLEGTRHSAAWAWCCAARLWHTRAARAVCVLTDINSTFKLVVYITDTQDWRQGISGEMMLSCHPWRETEQSQGLSVWPTVLYPHQGRCGWQIYNCVICHLPPQGKISHLQELQAS